MLSVLKLGKALLKVAVLVALVLLVGNSAFASSSWAPIGVEISEGSAQDRSTSKITLFWHEAAPSATYRVFISTNGESWTEITSSPISQLSFTDPTERRDYMNYFYQVKALGTNLIQEVQVFPPNTNAHKNYVSNPAVCKDCHRTHKAEGQNLLKEATVKAICETCHWGNTGSKYNVKTGEVITANGTVVPSLAGPLGWEKVNGEAQYITSWGGVVTSTHDTTETELKAPGGNSVSLTCSSCHSGHETGNYRNLNNKVGDKINVWVTGRAVTTTSDKGETGVHISGYNDFCSSCHEQYDRRDSRSGSSLRSGDQHYRHTIGVTLNSGRYATSPLSTTLPLENGKIICGTCHLAHGTTVMGTNESEVRNNGKANNDGQSTMLKRRPEMGVCQDCHKK